MPTLTPKNSEENKEWDYILKVHTYFQLLNNGRLTLEEICRDLSMDWRLRFERNTKRSFTAEIEKRLFNEYLEEGKNQLPLLLKEGGDNGEEIRWRTNPEFFAYEEIIDELADLVVTYYRQDDSRIDADGKPVQYLGDYEITTALINTHINYFLEEKLEEHNLYL